LQEWPRREGAKDWAATQNSLGNALAKLGEPERGTARLEEAVSAYREALEAMLDYARASAPLDWAAIQMNLGNALEKLGERESGTARLEEAISAYREALQEYNRARAPIDWVATQMANQWNGGDAIRALGEQGNGAVMLEEAVSAFRYALQEWTRARVPLQWAKSTGNLGVALTSRSGGATRRRRSWRCSSSRRLTWQHTTAAMRLRPPNLKRNRGKPVPLPRCSPSAEGSSRGAEPFTHRHCERSEASQLASATPGLLRCFAPCNDAPHPATRFG
jgi:tetratricopeptide (TPR) repeat protein